MRSKPPRTLFNSLLHAVAAHPLKAKMKKPLAWAASWALYGLGHAVSIPMCKWDRMAFLYPVYNWLMLRSSRVRDWGGLPWA